MHSIFFWQPYVFYTILKSVYQFDTHLILLMLFHQMPFLSFLSWVEHLLIINLLLHLLNLIKSTDKIVFEVLFNIRSNYFNIMILIVYFTNIQLILNKCCEFLVVVLTIACVCGAIPFIESSIKFSLILEYFICSLNNRLFNRANFIPLGIMWSYLLLLYLRYSLSSTLGRLRTMILICNLWFKLLRMI